ncbi:MAG: hypothetical protein HRT73_10450 [Flavobacteriales bacterium]|nr:hypothetical protein [Flavobacteriales bacterium]
MIKGRGYLNDAKYFVSQAVGDYGTIISYEVRELRMGGFSGDATLYGVGISTVEAFEQDGELNLVKNYYNFQVSGYLHYIYQGLTQHTWDAKVEEFKAHGPLSLLRGPVGGGTVRANLTKTVKINRGSRRFFLDQGTASSGWKHIFDRHVDVNRFMKKSKFNKIYDDSDIKGLMNTTIKHGAEGSFEGLSTFTKRIRFKGVSKKYRATVNEDGSIRTFHPLEE